LYAEDVFSPLACFVGAGREKAPSIQTYNVPRVLVLL